MKKFTGSLVIVLALSNSAFAICYNKYVSAANSSNLGCYDTPPVYTAPSGCSISSSQMVGCLAFYEICCTGDTTRYEDGAAQTMTGSNVTVGQEYEVANQLYEEALAGVGGSFSPSCQAGFRTTSEGKGFIYDVKPDPANLTKSEVRVSMFDRVGCESFSNNTTIILEPIGGTGGGGSGGSTDMTATNTILNNIKTRLDQLPATDNNPVLTEIKTILENGLAVTGGGSTDMTATNNLLDAIKTKLDGSCSLQWSSNGGECGWWGPGFTLEPPYTWQCTGGNVQVCDGLVVKDSQTLQALNDIKDLLASGGGSGGSTDMTETNGILSTISGFITDIKDFFAGASSLPENVDNTASKPAYSSSFFETGTPTLDSYKTAFNGFTNDMKATPLFGLVGGFFGGAPTGGSSVVSFNGGVYGTHSYDFSSWSSIMSVIKGIILVMFAAASMKIIFLKGGSG